MQQKTQQKIPKAEFKNKIESGIKANDQQRAVGLHNLAAIRGKKARLLERERQRLELKYDDARHPRVQQVADNQVVNLDTLKGLRMEENRVSTPCYDKAGKDCVARGRVYDRNGNAVQGAAVALHDVDGKRVDQVDEVQTDKDGCYQLRYSGEFEQPPAEERAVDDNGNVVTSDEQPQSTGPGLNINTNIEELRQLKSSGPTVYALAHLPDDDTVCAASVPFMARPGGCTYRDMILNIKQDIYEPGEGRRSTRYLGNSASRELHDLNNEKPGCRIDSIRFDHVVNFKSQEPALKAGYDYCAYCFGREKSKR